VPFTSILTRSFALMDTMGVPTPPSIPDAMPAPGGDSKPIHLMLTPGVRNKVT
jgi:hypothetical protein